MKIKLLIWLLAIFLLIYIVSAEVEPRGSCELTRPGYNNESGSRPERNFTGVYGVFVMSAFDLALNKTVYWREIKCFSPGDPRLITPGQTNTGSSTPTCEKVCKEKTIKVCKWIRHRCGHKKICYEKTIQKCRRICK